MFAKEEQRIEKAIMAYCEKNDIPLTEVKWAHIPFSGEWGIATSFFETAAREARSGKRVKVPVRAQEIAESVAEALGVPVGFSRVEAVRGYLNLYFASILFSQQVVDQIIAEGDDFGKGAPKGMKVMVEYSQPNTHKPLHVGHLRNMILGAAICNILEAAGYEVIRVNYPGDTGLHVIKWMWNYLKNHKGEMPGVDKVQWMGSLYTEANQLLEGNEELEAEMRALFSRWEAGDPELVDLWKETRQWSLDAFEEVYDLLGIPFDYYYYQSDLEAAGKAVVQELLDRNLAEDERPDGPVIVRIDDLLKLNKDQYRVMVALRSDSTALYSTWDLALAIKKFEDHDLEKCVYIIDVRQSLHLQQVWKTLEIMGYPWTDKLYHLGYEIVNLPGNVTMASREGTIIKLEDLLREAKKRAFEVVAEKNPDLPVSEQEEVAWSVALGAIKYPLLARDNAKIATFDWESALDFNGQAAPYIQYMHVRANSILRRAGEPLPASTMPKHALESAEVTLIDLLARTPDEVQKAAEEFKTLYITNLAYEISKAFSNFYNQCHVLKADPEVRDFRLRLVSATRQTLSNLLGMLGVPAPEVM